MAEAAAGHRLRDPRRRLGPGVPPPRERDRPDRGRARQAAGADLDAQRDGARWATRRWPSRWATSACCTRRSTSTGADALVMYFVGGHYRQPLAFSRRGAGRGRRRVRALRELVPAARPRGARAGGAGRATPSASSTPWPTTSTPPRPAPCCSSGLREANRRLDAGERRGAGAPARDAARAGPRGPCSRRTTRPRRRGRAPAGASARRPGRRATSSAPTGCATSWRRAAGRCATPPEGARLVRALSDRLRAQPGARGAARARARCSGSGPRERAAGEDWLDGVEVDASRGATRSRSCAGPPTTRASAPRPGPTPTPTPGSPARAPRTRSWSCLDEVQDPHNLGAVCRVAEAAGRAGVVIPERRSAEVTPAVCKASAGAVEHLPVARVRNLADWLARRRRPARGSTAPTAEAPWPTTQPDYRGRVVLVLGSEGRGPAAARGRCLRPAGGAAAARAGWGRSTCPPRRPRWCTGSCNCARGA